ncbi:MAG: glycosyltransferase family 9 protein [Candidatus Caenarcaniphilales bacterium]|nr:glycosyltransferase family 9 protein [Candidatus Caenarcaniphilales bacterium]
MQKVNGFVKTEKILVIPLRFIGDTILTIPLLRNLRYLFPSAQIDVLVTSQTSIILEVCPYISNLIREDTKGEFTEKLKTQGYDSCFILRKSLSMALKCKLAGLKNVIGFDKQRTPIGYKRWGLFLDYKLRYPTLRTETHQVKTILSFLQVFEKSQKDEHLELWSLNEDEQSVEKLLEPLNSEKRIACINLSSFSHGKNIPAEKFSKSVKYLHQKGFELIFTGVKNDEVVCEELKKLSSVHIHNFCGLTNLRELFALYKKTEFLLTLDSGPIHIAAAAGVEKIVGVYGPTNEKQWAPFNKGIEFYPVFLDLACRPCYAKVCAHNSCKVDLTEDMILNKVVLAVGNL